MKYICVFICVLVAVLCINGQGIPTKKCPPGTHSVVYCPRKAEPDCNNRIVHDKNEDADRACGIADCFCDEPTVRNKCTGECVLPSDCPKETE